MYGAAVLSQVRDLDLQLLRLFVCVVESGGFSAAQGELGIGQSTISTQMAKLETRLGFRLCERGKAGFRLTPKGEQVLLATHKLFGAIDTFKGEAQGMADKLLGTLNIGLSEALDNQVLERLGAAIGRFRQRNQAVQIELLSAMPAELERRLLQDQLHLATGYFSRKNRRCTAAAATRCSTSRASAASSCWSKTACTTPTVSSSPSNSGSPPPAARAANRSKAAWPSSSPARISASCPGILPRPGKCVACCAR